MDNKPKHTPGPWMVRKDGLGIDNKRHKIFDVSTGLEPKREDAQLIASAPDMLEALELLVTAFPELQTDEELSGADVIEFLANNWQVFTKTIAKATGGTE